MLRFSADFTRALTCAGAYILANTPPPREQGISADVIWGEKYEKAKSKGENVKEKGRKEKEKGGKGKENEKRGSKRVK